MLAIIDKQTSGCAKPTDVREKLSMIAAALLPIRTKLSELRAHVRDLELVESALLAAANAGLNFDLIEFKKWAEREASNLSPYIQQITFAKVDSGIVEFRGEKQAAVYLELAYDAFSNAIERFLGIKLEARIVSGGGRR